MTYKIEYSKQAEKDVENLFDVIVNNFKAPITAFKYVDGLIHTINNLRKNASIYTIVESEFVKLYGSNVKRINYKKMAIFFTIYEDVVYIHRIIPAATVN